MKWLHYESRIVRLGDQISVFAQRISNEQDPVLKAELKVQQAEVKVQQADLKVRQARNENGPEEEIQELKGKLKEAEANLEKANAHQERLQQGIYTKAPSRRDPAKINLGPQVLMANIISY